jgi:peptidoglycan hydrolase CwlO-like protein
MILVSNSWRMYLVGLAVSLAIFGIVYFTVIKPSSDTANQAAKTGLQQSSQALNQVQKQVGQATSQAGGTSGQAQQTISKVQKLTTCLASAGTDLTKVQACRSQFGQ